MVACIVSILVSNELIPGCEPEFNCVTQKTVEASDGAYVRLTEIWEAFQQENPEIQNRWISVETPSQMMGSVYYFSKVPFTEGFISGSYVPDELLGRYALEA